VRPAGTLLLAREARDDVTGIKRTSFPAACTGLRDSYTLGGFRQVGLRENFAAKGSTVITNRTRPTAP